MLFRIFIHLEGTPAEIGYQHGYLLAPEIADAHKAIKTVLQETPPELASDIIDKGMVMTGGSALLRNLDRYISDQLKVPAYVAEDPLLSVARGTGVALDHLDSYKKSILSIK